MSASAAPDAFESALIRDLRDDDLRDVVRIDGLHSGEEKPRYWSDVFPAFAAARAPGRVGLAAEENGRVVAYLLGEVRAFEFGSEACGWVFALGVEASRRRAGLATKLLDAACARFRATGVERVRTMVRRNDVPMLSFFRSAGFVGGSFVQLELPGGEEP